jgi:hypothetical protein
MELKWRSVSELSQFSGSMEILAVDENEDLIVGYSLIHDGKWACENNDDFLSEIEYFILCSDLIKIIPND